MHTISQSDEGIKCMQEAVLKLKVTAHLHIPENYAKHVTVAMKSPLHTTALKFCQSAFV